MTTTPAAEDREGNAVKRSVRNDARIIEAARAVFTADPSAPVAAVAAKAGVGISALYRRYPSKELLLAELCRQGLERYIAEATRAADDPDDPWRAFAGFMARIVDANTHALVVRLAGTFRAGAALFDLAAQAQALNERIFERAAASGAFRPGVSVDDMNVIGELLATVHIGDERRTGAVRQRYLAILLDGLRYGPADLLPAPAPTWAEIQRRWA